MFERRATQQVTRQPLLRALGGVDHELDGAVLDGVHDVRAALLHTVDVCGGDTCPSQGRAGTAGGDEVEAEIGQATGNGDGGRLVVVAH